MKSSCGHEDKVNRQMNAMEMKVNLYKQQVNELQTQLDKMRQLNNERYELLKRQVTAISANMDMNFLLEHKMNRLETEVQQLNIDMTAAKITMPGTTKSLHQNDEVRSSEADLSALPHNIQSMVQYEVKLFADDFTSKFQTYVLEQILLYNKVFSNRPKYNGASQQQHKNFTQLASMLSLPTESGESVERLRRLIQRDGILAREYENLKVTNGGYQSQKHTSSSVKYIPSDESWNVTGRAQAVRSKIPRNKRHHVITNSQSEDSDEAIENNESFSGENPEANDTSLDDSLTSMEQDVSSSASSRISQTSEPDANSTVTQFENKDTEKATNKHLDQCYNKINEMERRLRKEITDVLYTPLAEVVRLVEKLKVDTGEQILKLDNKCEQANKQSTLHITELQNSVHATQQDLQSVYEDVHESTAKLDKVNQLEEVISDLIKNITTNSRTESDLENEEQGKRIKKLERLMGVYQQSLQHYRNETKHEYREMRVSLDKETNALKLFTKALQNNINETVTYEMTTFNNSYNKRLQDINEQIRAQEDALLHVQMDIEKAEKMLESKQQRSDHDYDDMQETINHVVLKQKDFTKKLENIEQFQDNINEKINAYGKDIVSLQIESRLNTDEWLPLTFEFDSSRTECFGDQYVKRTNYTKAKYVGVVLCSETRYKIFLSSSLNGTFMNVGDASGMGEDHCEFVGASRDAPAKLSVFKLTFGTTQGYARNHWGQDLVITYLNAIKPSPHWYECGVKIP
ncbi:hypothetical protein BsWGS_08363 [Bradybaena similaris]